MEFLIFTLLVSMTTAAVIFLSAQNRLFDMSARHYKAQYFMNLMKVSAFIAGNSGGWVVLLGLVIIFGGYI